MPVFRGNPIIRVPYFDKSGAIVSGSEPIYMINHNVFYPVILKNGYMRRTGPHRKGGQHDVRETFIDLSYNFICCNRRACAIVAKAAPVSSYPAT